MESSIKVTSFDHIVLRCADIERTLSWYIDVLGLGPERVDEWRLGEAPFPSARVDAGTIIDFIEGDTNDGRLDHLCLVIAEQDLEVLASSGVFEVVDGPGPRFGAQGVGESLYVLDPDGGTVELRHYGARL
jgi:catechol 2,3-dioxygenase-like lactoylglutathione lyase family enzyme